MGEQTRRGKIRPEQKKKRPEKRNGFDGTTKQTLIEGIREASHRRQRAGVTGPELK